MFAGRLLSQVVVLVRTILLVYLVQHNLATVVPSVAIVACAVCLHLLHGLACFMRVFRGPDDKFGVQLWAKRFVLFACDATTHRLRFPLRIFWCVVHEEGSSPDFSI